MTSSMAIVSIPVTDSGIINKWNEMESEVYNFLWIVLICELNMLVMPSADVRHRYMLKVSTTALIPMC